MQLYWLWLLITEDGSKHHALFLWVGLRMIKDENTLYKEDKAQIYFPTKKICAFVTSVFSDDRQKKIRHHTKNLLYGIKVLILNIYSDVFQVFCELRRKKTFNVWLNISLLILKDYLTTISSVVQKFPSSAFENLWRQPVETILLSRSQYEILKVKFVYISINFYASKNLRYKFFLTLFSILSVFLWVSPEFYWLILESPTQVDAGLYLWVSTQIVSPVCSCDV